MYYIPRAYTGMEAKLHMFLSSVLDKAGGIAPCPRKTTGAHCTEGWVGANVILNMVVKRNISDATTAK
jgi:hypothetical protein